MVLNYVRMVFMFRLLPVAALAAAATLTVSSCAVFSDSAEKSGGDGELTVVTAFYPLQFVAERVAGDRARVTNLTQPGQEPHDLELSVKQTADVATADLVVYESGLQVSVEAAADQSSAATVDAADVAGLEPIGHDGHDAQLDDGDLDPHFWQDPLKLAKVADAVADELGTLDPANKATYDANAAALDSDLSALDQEYAAGLTGCMRDTIVVSHDAFGYLGRYGLHIEPIAGLSPDAEPTPADLGRLHDLIESKGITTVFGETLVSAKIADTLANDLGITTAVLDPIEGLTDQTADQDYLSLMRANLDALKEANGCQ